MTESAETRRVREILAEAKRIGGEYYRLTGKPLGVTGEVAEFVVAELLGFDLAPPRTQGYDAIRQTATGPQRIQIKGRALTAGKNSSQRVGTIKRGAPYDAVILVLMDNSTFDPLELWEADFAAVEAQLAVPGSKSRDRGALGVSEFKKIARQIWPPA